MEALCYSYAPELLAQDLFTSRISARANLTLRVLTRLLAIVILPRDTNSSFSPFGRPMSHV